MLATLAVPAVIIGVCFSRRVIVAASAVELTATVVDWFWNDYGLVPIGGFLPEPPVLMLYLLQETVVALVIAVLLALTVRLVKRKIIDWRLGNATKKA